MVCSYAPLSFTFFSRLPDPAFNVALLLIGKSPSLQTSGSLHRLDRRLRDLAFVLKTMRLEEAQNLTIIDVPDKEQVGCAAWSIILNVSEMPKSQRCFVESFEQRLGHCCPALLPASDRYIDGWFNAET